MKRLLLCSLLATLAAAPLHAQAPSPTAFSYQGRLHDAGAPATGSFDLKFELYDADAAGNLIGAAVERAAVAAANGLFTTDLDFGGPEVFNGAQYWLQISVKPAGGPDYTVLAPRQVIRPVPYAIRAQQAATVADGSVTAASLAAGAVTGAAIAPGSVALDQLNTTGAPATGMVLAFDGANLTWLTPGGGGVGGGSLTLPFSGLASQPGALFSVNNMNATGDAWGIYGHSQTNLGVFGQTHGEAQAGVLGRNDGATGVNGAGVFGYASTQAHGVLAISEQGHGVWAATNGENKVSVYAQTHQNSSTAAHFRHIGTSGSALVADANGGWAVFGRSQTSLGVFGQTIGNNSSGVHGRSEGAGGNGVFGYAPGGSTGTAGVSVGGHGVYGQSDNAAHAGGYFRNTAPGGDALRADGPVRVNGRTVTQVLEITGGADLAEPFAMRDQHEIEPGSVMVISGEGTGTLELSTRAHDKRVAGIVSGAKGIQPGLRLRQEDAGVVGGAGGRDVALTGRVWCLCDATDAAVEQGDLLTTSAMPGHAMRVSDHDAATGAILGKAMSSLPRGKTGHVLVLVSLQ